MEFFVEFEFQSLLRGIYWFPLFIGAASREEAEDHATRIETGLRQNYELLSRSEVIPVVPGFNSKRIAEYRLSRAMGRPIWLNIVQWTMKSVDGAADVPFEQQTDEEAANAFGEFRDAVFPVPPLAEGRPTRFPVHVVLAEKPIQNDYLAINVVMLSPVDSKCTTLVESKCTTLRAV